MELKDTGVRDENGIEPIPSFSSPAKPAMQSDGISHDITDSVDDSMDIVESKIGVKESVANHSVTKSYCFRYDTGAFRNA